MSINLRRQKKAKVNINIDPRTINPVYQYLYDNDTPTQIVFGGSSSGKSHAIASFVVLWALRGRNILVVRQVAASIRKSVYNELIKAISRLKLGAYFTINKTDLLIQCNISDGAIMFVGCDDVEKVKSITPPKASGFDVEWLEEATELSESTFNQLQLRMRGKTKFKKKTIVTFNPIYESHWIYKRWFIGEQSDDVLILKTTYKDNKFLGDEEIKVLEDMKNVSPYHYDVYCLGNFGVLGSRVFENWTAEYFDVNDIRSNNYIGLDFGYSVDPASVCFMKYDQTNRTIYIYDELYMRGLTNDKLAQEIHTKLLSNNITSYEILCDSAEPKSIQELRDHGIRANKTIKGPDSILKGIDWILQNKIKVHPRCVNMIEELKLYIRKEINGEIQKEPIDKYNHLIDAMRYGTSGIWHHSAKVTGIKSSIY